MAFVHRGTVTRGLCISLAHLSSFFGVAVIVGPSEVIHPGTRIYPNDSICRTAAVRLLVGCKLAGANGSWQ
jgi:hypothetical protein